MAYFVRAGTDASRNFFSVPLIDLTGDFAIEIDAKLTSVGNWRAFGRLTSFDSRLFKWSGESRFIIASDSQVNTENASTDADYSQRNLFTVIRNSGEITLRINGRETGARWYDNGAFRIDALLTQDADNKARCGTDLYRFTVWSDSSKTTKVRNYDPTASYGQGVLVDTVGGNNGTPVNFPTDFNDALIFYNDGGGAVEQPVVSVNAEEVHQANTLSITSFNSVSSVIAEQVESANLIDVFLSQLTSSIQAQEAHESTALNIEQSAAQSVNSLTAEQIEEANSIGITQSALINSIQAQENQQANTLTVEQSAGQSISLNTAQQVEQATVLSLAQQQALAHIVAEQLSDASVTDVSNLQAVTMIIAEETHKANTLNVEQYTGQFVTLITAEQKSEAQTLLISEVSAIDVLQAEQVTNAETMAFSQLQRLTQITAEQLTEAQLLTILTSGDNTDLSGLRLIPVTSKYTINPTNTTRYSLQKV